MNDSFLYRLSYLFFPRLDWAVCDRIEWLEPGVGRWLHFERRGRDVLIALGDWLLVLGPRV